MNNTKGIEEVDKGSLRLLEFSNGLMIDLARVISVSDLFVEELIDRNSKKTKHSVYRIQLESSVKVLVIEPDEVTDKFLKIDSVMTKAEFQRRWKTYINSVSSIVYGYEKL